MQLTRGLLFTASALEEKVSILTSQLDESRRRLEEAENRVKPIPEKQVAIEPQIHPPTGRPNHEVASANGCVSKVVSTQALPRSHLT